MKWYQVLSQDVSEKKKKKPQSHKLWDRIPSRQKISAEGGRLWMVIAIIATAARIHDV